MFKGSVSKEEYVLETSGIDFCIFCKCSALKAFHIFEKPVLKFWSGNPIKKHIQKATYEISIKADFLQNEVSRLKKSTNDREVNYKECFCKDFLHWVHSLKDRQKVCA
jgi:hypothetical protein